MHSEKIRKIYNNLTEETDSTDEIYGHLKKQILELLGEDEKEWMPVNTDITGTGFSR